MKNLASTRNKHVNPSPFEFAALLEDPNMPGARKNTLVGEKIRGMHPRSTTKKLNPTKQRKIGFQLTAPSARSVRLAADFTDWEKSAIEMNKNAGGIWKTSVSLAAGCYAYRFIVDGEWQDDPRRMERVLNPFGTYNTTIEVL